MTDPVINKLAFNGYNLYYFYGRGHGIDIERHRSDSYLQKSLGRLPTVEEFVANNASLGRTILLVKDDNGVVLYDNRTNVPLEKIERAEVDPEAVTTLAPLSKVDPVGVI